MYKIWIFLPLKWQYVRWIKTTFKVLVIHGLSRNISHYRRIFVYIFCLISICFLFSYQPIEINSECQKNITISAVCENLSLIYSRTPLFRSPKGNGKKFEIAGLRNNRGSVKGKGKSKGIWSSFKIAGTSNSPSSKLRGSTVPNTFREIFF